MATGPETGRARARRRRQRALFDGAADLYDACRLGYPADIVGFLFATAALEAGSTMLEIGCGTGQLTEDLAHSGYALTAIDIGPSMVAAARRRLAGAGVSFRVTSFEALAAPAGSFGLIVSGTAFHWLDPEVRVRKSARLLRPGGWLALLATEERYDDPVGAELLSMWVARSDDGGAWATGARLSDTQIIEDAGVFAEPVTRIGARRLVLPADAVVGIESTRATSLSWPDDVRRDFADEIRHRLRSQAEVQLSQQTTLTMARRRDDRVHGQEATT